MKTDARILVAGAGIGGLTAGVALRKAGLPVELFERAPALTAVGAGLAMQSNALLALGHIGLDEAVIEAGCRIERGFFTTWKGRALFELPIAAVRRSTGKPMVAILRSRLQEILLGAFGGEGLHLGQEVEGYSQTADGVRLEMRGGEWAFGDVLVGADGLRSVVRQQMLGPERLRYAGYTSWRGLSPASDLLEAATAVELWGPGARFGYVPVGDGLIYWFAAANAPEGSQDLGGDAKGRVLARFASWHGPVRALIESTPERLILRTDIHDRPPGRRWTDGRVALLGDAAHPMTPNMGQGACQAIEDAVVLARCLLKGKAEPGALAEYAAKRKARAQWIVEQSRRIGLVGQLENPIALALRDAAMARTPQPVLERQLLRAASFSL